MVTVTNNAQARFLDILSDSPVHVAIRIFEKGNRLSLRRGKARPGDNEVKHGDRVILLLSHAISKRLQGKVIDVRQTEEGPRIGVRRAADSERSPS